MKLDGMTFAPNSEGEALPETITVTMTTEEALWMALIAGQQRGESPHHGVYTCLIGDVFNRYWFSGTDDAIKDFPVEIPPITYDT